MSPTVQNAAVSKIMYTIDTSGIVSFEVVLLCFITCETNDTSDGTKVFVCRVNCSEYIEVVDIFKI